MAVRWRLEEKKCVRKFLGLRANPGFNSLKEGVRTGDKEQDTGRVVQKGLDGREVDCEGRRRSGIGDSKIDAKAPHKRLVMSLESWNWMENALEEIMERTSLALGEEDGQTSDGHGDRSR